MDANFVCLCCEAAYHKNNHHCCRECRISRGEVLHFDFCQRCQNLLMHCFIGQMTRPKLRVENKERTE